MYLCFVFLFVIRDKNEQLDEEIQRAGTERAPSTGVSAPLSSWGVRGAPPSWHVDVFTNQELSKPHHLRF